MGKFMKEGNSRILVSKPLCSTLLLLACCDEMKDCTDSSFIRCLLC